MDGRTPQIGDRGGSETYVGPQGGVNSVLFTAVHHIWDQEVARRRGGLDLAHVKGHSKDVLNERADTLANLGKGAGPFSRQIVPTYSVHPDVDQRIEEGEGYPHQPVPGAYACVFASSAQREDLG